MIVRPIFPDCPACRVATARVREVDGAVAPPAAFEAPKSRATFRPPLSEDRGRRRAGRIRIVDVHPRDREAHAGLLIAARIVVRAINDREHLKTPACYEIAWLIGDEAIEAA